MTATLEQLQQAWTESAATGGSSQRDEFEPDTFPAILGDCSVGAGKKNPDVFRTYIPFRALDGINKGKGGLKTEQLATAQNLSFLKEDFRRMEIEAPEDTKDIPAAVAQMSGLGVEMTVKQSGEYTNFYINGLMDVSDYDNPTSFADTVAESEEEKSKDIDDMDTKELLAEIKSLGLKVPSKRKLESMDDDDLRDIIDPPPAAE
jgi:hypothetical protein